MSNGPYVFEEYTIGSQPFCFNADGTLVTGLRFPEIDPSVIILGHANVDAGTERPTKIGARSRIDHYAHVGHDCILGEDVTVAAGAILCGFVEVEDNVYIGAGARIRQRLRLGEGCLVGMGAVVVRDVPPGVVVVGNPARFLKLRWPIAWYDGKIETHLLTRDAAAARSARWDGSKWTSVPKED